MGAQHTPGPPASASHAFKEGWRAYFEGKRKDANNRVGAGRAAWFKGHAEAAAAAIAKTEDRE